MRMLRLSAAALLGASLLTLTACGTSQTEPGSTPSETTSTEADHDHDHEGEGTHDDHADDDHDEQEGATNATEAAGQTPRVVTTYDGGILVLDALTLETVADLPLAGFNRLAGVGDGRHVAVSTTGGWAIVDAGTWSQGHGDHNHYYTADPALHDVILKAEAPAHVVVHDGLTTFFDDGTGQVTVVEISEWADQVEHAHLHPIREYTTAEPHHGVGVAMEDGTLLVTRGDEEARTGAMILDADGKEIVASDECPGVHGETAFESSDGDEVILLGCDDGVLTFHGDHAHKLASPDEYGRIGNAFSVDGNDVVLGDYKNDPEAGLGLSQVSLVDTAAEKISVVDPFGGNGSQYTWRDLARGAAGEALVFGTDGVLRVLDPATGKETRSIPVIDGGWTVPEDWQSAHPALMELEGMAYVTDPATNTIHIVDYAGGTVWKSVEVGKAPVEIVGVTG
ncbi:hypothetical protein [Tessaracoccus caeni]|uniref:hypothetical protein n=1 Tax=Tessaracoccus caeni TaxID=3031239 RepID=UPI0023DC7D34|nr:hypothetical protein [Tessaracoccus caeni]MDF1487473.1 hypothetical protein [Tessaracoccus caeni]